MKKILIALAALVSIAGFNGTNADAALLANLNLNFDITIPTATISTTNPFFDYGGGVDLFEELSLTAGDAGSSYSRVLGGADADFVAIASNLTDGANQNLEIGTILNFSLPQVGALPIKTSVNNLESDWFGGNANSLNGIDFAGYTIDNVTLNVNSLVLSSTTGQATGSYSFQINGTRIPTSGPAIPEPGTFVLAGLGISIAALRKKFKR